MLTHKRGPSEGWCFRTDLNWCPGCWQGARIEQKTNKVGIRVWVCTNCGAHGNYLGSNLSFPRFFTLKEWDHKQKEKSDAVRSQKEGEQELPHRE